MTTDTFPLPSTYAYGKVVGRIIYAIGDTAEDADDKPQARAAAGTVTFTPMATGAKVTTADYTAIVMNGAVKANLSSSGRILDAEGRQGIWLIQGIYRVRFDFTATSDGLRGSLPDLLIEVTDAHTDLAPLDLASAAPASVPEGAVVQTVILPSGSGIVSRNATTGAIEYIDPDDLGGTTTVDGLMDATTVGKAVVKAADAAAARTAISAASAAQGEKADSAVQRTGAETVAGVKTFTSIPVVPDSSFAPVKLSATGTRDSTSYLRGDGIWATPPGAVVYGTTAGTAAQGNDSRFSDAASLTTGTVAAARLPAATEASPGTLEIATTGETTTGTLDNVIVTPLKLKAVADTKAALSHTHTAVDLPASIPHDVWQPSGGTWPARPTVPSGARVNAIGYPGLTDVPSWLVSGTDSYTMRTA